MVSASFLLVVVACVAAVSGRSDFSKDQGTIVGDLCALNDLKLVYNAPVGSENSWSGPTGHQLIGVSAPSKIAAYQLIDLKQNGNNANYKVTKGGIGQKQIVLQFSGKYQPNRADDDAIQYRLLVWAN